MKAVHSSLDPRSWLKFGCRVLRAFVCNLRSIFRMKLSKMNTGSLM